MSAEWAAVYITVFGFIGTIFNVWITLRTSNAILGVKLWARETFVAKEDLRGYMREHTQLGESIHRAAR